MFRKTCFLSLLFVIFAFACAPKGPPKVAKLDIDRDEDPYYQFMLADVLSMKGETRKSTKELKKLIETYPDMAFLYYLLAQNYGQERSMSEAILACKHAIELAPRFVDAKVFLGQLYESEDMHSDAQRMFVEAIGDDPKREEIYPMLARAYIATRENKSAISAIRRLLNINPDSVVAYMYLASIYEQHLWSTSKALKAYREALSIDPNNANVYNAIAQLYLRKKDLKGALRMYIELAHLMPDDIAVQLRIALIHYELKEYDQAIDVFQRILEGNPEADKIRYYLGILYESVDKPDQAIAELSQVPSNSSYYKDARLHIASLHKLKGRLDEAVASLRHAIGVKPSVPAFYEYLAAIFEEGEDYAAAIAILSEGHEALPDNEAIIFMLAVAYERTKERDLAMDAMRRVLRINPQNANALNYIGYTYAEQGKKLDEALELIQQALLLRPDDGYITDSLGWVYFKMGDNEKALKNLLEASRLVKGEPTVLYHLGEVMLRRGDSKRALDYFEQALKAGEKRERVDEQEMKQIRQRIEELGRVVN